MFCGCWEAGTGSGCCAGCGCTGAGGTGGRLGTAATLDCGPVLPNFRLKISKTASSLEKPCWHNFRMVDSSDTSKESYMFTPCSSSCCDSNRPICSASLEDKRSMVFCFLPGEPEPGEGVCGVIISFCRWVMLPPSAAAFAASAAKVSPVSESESSENT